MAETKTVAVLNSAQPAAFTPGSQVWIPDPTLEWVSAEVVNDNNGEPNITVTNEEGDEVQVPRVKVYLKNPEILEGSDDLAALSYMSEPHILHNLHINPYARIPLYGADMINAYYGKPIGALSPHVYAIAEDAFKDMRIEGASQSILVSGESGAGKTETTKYILQYFAAMGGLLRQAGATTAEAEESKQASIEERVLESTPLLEAVGNAKTLRNDNSSRFGKFIEIHFNEHGNIIGAKILTYLLEKSRIVRQVKGERNYHIFYQLIAGASDELREELNLLTAEEYYYLAQSECTTVDEVDDAEVFERTIHAMKVSGMTDEMLRDCWTLVAGILWLGNIKFIAKGEGAAIEDTTPLENTCKILKCSQADLEQSLITKKISTKTESYNVPLNPDQAENARDTLAMLLYSQLFEFLVAQINNALVTKKKPKSFIGILDIYGFECFEKNGFEQFCINFANEKLQQLFNLHVFKEEQQEYIKEKIDWSYVDFADNQDTLDLIEKKPLCILTLLDEESTFPKSTNLTFATKLFSKLQHPRFEKPRFSNAAFTISHYAGKVTYDTEGFLEKNKDFTIPEQIALLQKSNFPFVKALTKVIAQQQQGAAGTKFTSVGAQFATSLGVLMKTIMSTSPHYIRCIKPNPTKEPSLFIKKDVMHQLRCGGVMESVRICCAGFPTRRPLDKFYERYKILAPRKKGKDFKQMVLSIVNHLKLDEDKFKIGTTKIFLRSGQLASLENYRTERLEASATTIQKVFRGMASRKYYLQLRRSSIKIQTAIRKMQARRLLVGLRRTDAALRIQTCFRAYIKRRDYRRTKRLATRLQLSILSWKAKRELAVYRHEAACITLQTFIRACFARSKLYRKRRFIVLLQSRWRGKLARRIYSQMRIEARSLATIQEAKNKLEAKLDEAAWRLQAERNAKAKLEGELEELKTAAEATQADKRKLEQDKRAYEHQLKEQEVKFSNELAEKNRIVEEQKARLDLELKAGKEEMQRQIERLRAENRDLQAREAQARELIEKLESEKTVANRHVEELTAALHKLKDDHREYVNRAREAEVEKNEEYDKLQAEMEELKTRSNEAENYARQSKIEMAEEISRLQQQLADSSSGASAKGEELEKLSKTIESLETELNTLKEAHQKLQESNAEYLSSINKLKASEADLEEQLKATKTQMAQEIANKDSLLTRKTQDNSEYEETIKKLKNSLADTEREVQKHLQEINRLSDNSRRDVEKARDDKEYLESRLKNEIDTLKQDIYNLKDTNMQIRQEKDSQLRTMEESYNRRLTERQERISTLEDQISSMKEIKQKFEGELVREKSQDSLYFKEMSALQEVMLKKHQDELDEKRKLADRLQDEREQLREQLNLTKLDLQRSVDAQAQLESARKEATEKAKEKKEAAALLKEKLSQQQTELSRLQLENSQLMQRLEMVRSELESKIEKAKKKAKKARAENSGNEKEFMTLKAQNMVLEEQNSSANSKVQHLEALVLAAQKEAETKSSLLEEANRQITLLRQELNSTIQLSLSEDLRPSSPSSSSPSSSLSPSPALSRSGSLTAAPASPPLSTHHAASSAVSVKQALDKKEAEYQALLKTQTAKLEAEVAEWEKRVQKVREEKEMESDRLKKELDMWRERGLEAERKRYANVLVPPGLLITPFRAAYEESNKQREIMLKQSESKIAKWKIIEQAANFRETEWEKLSRNVGSGETETNMLTRFLLSCAENSLFPGHMLFHHVYYWRAIEMNNLPLLNAVAQTLHETVEMRQENLEEMAQLLACIGFLLYILYKSTNHNMEDQVKVPPLRSDQHITLSPKPDRCPRPIIKTGNDFIEYLKTVVGRTFSCILRILAKRMSTVLEGLFLMESYKSMKTTKNSPQTSPLGVAEITTLLSDSAISLFQQAFISTTFSQQIFSKVFRYISGYLLNGILLRQQFCSESFGVFIAPKIEALEQWAKRDAIWVGDAYQELGPVRQAAAVLQLKDKSVLVEEKNRRNICPTLSPTQLRQLLAMYSPEEYGKKIPITVINAILIPKTSQEQILTELNEVSGFQVSTIHYLEVSDTFQLPIPVALKAAIEKVCISDDDINGTS